MKSTHNFAGKVIAALLILAAVPLLYSCQKSASTKISETTQNMDAENTSAIEQKDKTNMELNFYFTHAMTKVCRDDKLPVEPMTEYTAYMAKNESEDFSFVLHPNEFLKELNFELSDFSNAKGNILKGEIFRQYYIETNDGKLFPDPIAPVRENFAIKADKNQSFLVNVKTTAETPAGKYSAILLLKQNGNTLLEIPLTVNVWDFALPAASSCATAVGLYPEFINSAHGITNEEKQHEMYKAYYDYMLDNHICAYNLPYDILDERCDQYLSDPRVTSFTIPYSDDDDVIKAYYEKLSSNPIWFDKGVFYPLDEPTSNEHLNKLAEYTERLNNIYPGCQIVTPFFRDSQYDANTDYVDFMTGKTNVWCPKSYMYISKNIYSYEQTQKYPSFGERMEQRKADGDKIWWYVCWEPGLPYLNLFLDMSGLNHRMLFWQQKLYNVDGFLYWGANYWAGTSDPWTDMRTVKSLSMDVFGDGSLLYNGNKAGIDGPCGSLRLNAVRDGIEDFDMFTLAEKEFGHQYVTDVINEVTGSLIKYTDDENVFAATRIKIGSALSDLNSK